MILWPEQLRKKLRTFESHPNNNNNNNNMIRAASLKCNLLVLIKVECSVRESAYEMVKAPVFKNTNVDNRSSHVNAVGLHLFKKRDSGTDVFL